MLISWNKDVIYSFVTLTFAALFAGLAGNVPILWAERSADLFLYTFYGLLIASAALGLGTVYFGIRAIIKKDELGNTEPGKGHHLGVVTAALGGIVVIVAVKTFLF
jgi:hypothetical protein